MNHESAIASTSAASAVSAYIGPGCVPSPMPRPASAIQLLPNAHVPYQRKPMTIAATVATTIATQFIVPLLRRELLRAAHRLRQGHKHSDASGVLVVCGAEALPQQTLLDPRPVHECRIGHEQRARDQREISGGET